jgi:probable phosphoglycerate mutase
MPLFLIRHGEAENQVTDITGGWTDTKLTKRGNLQAVRVGIRLKELLNRASCRIVSSDLKRALHTAEAIGKVLEVKPEVYHGLREGNNGDAAWKTKAEAKQIFIDPTEPLIDWCPYPNGESWRMLNARVVEVMNCIYGSSEENLVVVGHSGSLTHVTHWWLRIPEELIGGINYRFDNAAITVLSETDLCERTIERLNDAAHLAGL